MKLEQLPLSLASLNRRSEIVIVEAIIIPELELCDIEVQVSFTNLVEGADDGFGEGRQPRA